MTNPTPIIYVSHLPSASSFYASLTQPLNIRYLSATTTFPATLHFGLITEVGKKILFSITQSPIPNPQPTSIYLPAPTPKSVQDFYNKSWLINPGCQDTNIGDTEEGEKTKAITRDLDGNLVEAVYSTRGMRGVQTQETASTEGEARRVLAWQKEVAKSVVSAADARSHVSGVTEVVHRSPEPPVARRAESYPQPMRLIRRETVTEHYSPQDSTPSSTGNTPGGISGKAIIGTILGAAAGAAVAYAMVRSESPHRFSPQAGSTVSASRPRRASVVGPSPPSYYIAELPPPVDIAPARSHVSARGTEVKPRYVEYTITQPPPMVRAHTYDTSRMIDERSHVSSRHGNGSRVRAESEYRGSRFERPLTMLPRESSPETNVSRRSHKSHGDHNSGSKHRAKSHVSGAQPSESRRSHHSSSKREKSHSHVSERDSYASARSHNSESTVKPSRNGSTTTIRVTGGSGRERDREGGESRSYVSAREIPLPRSVVSLARDVALPYSVVGGSDYAASVAPSDSVSSVGMKRERERLRDRMGHRERW